MKALNYKIGALKRKFKIPEDFQPGELISKMNEQKSNIKNNKQPLFKKQVAIQGLV